MILPSRVNDTDSFNSLYFFLSVSTQFNCGCGVYCLRHTPAAAAAAPVEINRRKSRGPFLQQQRATRLAVLWVGVWLIFYLFISWVEKFSSVALTISIVVAASAHMRSIHNWAGCNKFTHVHQGPVQWNSGRWLLEVGGLWRSGCSGKSVTRMLMRLFASDVQVISSLVCLWCRAEMCFLSQKLIMECAMNI